MPRRTRSGELLSLGESAPPNWLTESAPGVQAVSFDNVDQDEFDDVVRYLVDALAKKKPASQPESSTAFAA